jgi:hypothetical protein
MTDKAEPPTSEAVGDLHTTDEFARTKRNLLWTCSFALLLWLVHVPENGLYDSPMLGASAKIDLKALQFAVWLACLYNFFGFWRQVRGVDRLNSQAIYTKEFEDLSVKLRQLGNNFAALSNRSNEARTAFGKLNAYNETGTRSIMDRLEADVSTKIDAAKDMVMKELYSDAANFFAPVTTGFEDLKERIRASIVERYDNLKRSAETRAEKMEEIAALSQAGTSVANSIRSLELQFDKLSNQIRAEHRVMYAWYDKYLTYTIFGLATVASFWHIVGDALHA